MKLQSASTAPAACPLGTQIVLTVGLLVLGAALSQAARAASDAIVDCKRLETSLRSLEVSVDELGDTADELASPPVMPISAGPAPVLRLAPRVATIMREVFDALPIVMLDDNGEVLDTVDQPAIDTIMTAPESSPVVNAPPAPKARTPEMQTETTDNSHYLPRFQRQMYRTDI